MMMFRSSSLMLIIFDIEGEIVSIIYENSETCISVARENDAADLFQIVTPPLFPIAAEAATMLVCHSSGRLELRRVWKSKRL